MKIVFLKVNVKYFILIAKSILLLYLLLLLLLLLLFLIKINH